MKRPIARFLAAALLMLVMMGSLIYRLGTLTIAEGQVWTEQAADRMIRTIAVKGNRGRILDRNGVVLAYSETCYNVEFMRNADNRTNYDSVVYTDSLIKAIKIIEAGGGSVIDTSYVRMDENGEFYYDWGVTSDAAIRARYKNFCEAMFFSIDDPAYEEFPDEPSKWDLSLWPTAEYAYLTLRSSWFIPEEMPYEEAIKVISIRQEVNLNNYRAYEPITIAYDVGLEIVSDIMLHSGELVGLQVSQSTKRVYPRGETAAHVIGYLSRSADTVTASSLLANGYTQDELKNYYKTDENGEYVLSESGDYLIDMIDSKGLGYSYSDYIGVSGVEATMEAYLTGATKKHQGVREVEINKNGSIIRELSDTSGKDGCDVMLTMDIELQTVCENALKHTIEHIAQYEKTHIEDSIAEAQSKGKISKYDGKEIDIAATGSIVAIDITNGQIIAMASYPSYDPNWFIEGLSTEQINYLFKSEEAKATTPLRNKAISQPMAPGSIFKMVTGIAGVAEGAITLNETISDNSPYYIINDDGTVTKANAPTCWAYPDNMESHKNLNLTGALTVSCNYYFCEVANRLGIDKLNEWSGKFGLTSKTNIELTGESTGIVGGQAVLFDNGLRDSSGKLSIINQKTSLPSLVYRGICNKLREYLNLRGMEIVDEAVSSCALKLMELQNGTLDGKGPDIRRIISEEVGIPEGVTQAQGWVSEIISLLNEIQWKPTYTIRAGYGQGVSLVTPIAVSRYVAAIANEGTVFNPHIVDRIVDCDGNLVKQVEPTVANKIELPDEVWKAVKEGLKGVVSPEDRGTAANAFSPEFQQAGYLGRLTGKTGSAQVGINSIDIENTSWFITYTPRENPEIAVVVCIPNGYAGKQSALAIEEILTYYFNKQDSAAPENLAAVNSIVP